jgi:hypothetical protein
MHLLTRVGCSEGIVSDVEPSAIEGDSPVTVLERARISLSLRVAEIGSSS